MQLVSADKDGLSKHHFSENAAHGPYVHAGGVVLPRDHYFRSPVPSCGDVISQHGTRLASLLFGKFRAGKPEVTYLKITVLVEQQITRLQVSVENACTVYVLESAQELVEEELVMLFGEPGHGRVEG